MTNNLNSVEAIWSGRRLNSSSEELSEKDILQTQINDE